MKKHTVQKIAAVFSAILMIMSLLILPAKTALADDRIPDGSQPTETVQPSDTSLPSDNAVPTDTAEPSPTDSPVTTDTAEPSPTDSPVTTDTAEPTPTDSPVTTDTEEPSPSQSPLVDTGTAALGSDNVQTFADAGDFKYSVNPDNASVTITGYTGKGGYVTIPETIESKPITKIGDGAFSKNTDITYIIMPGGLTGIGTGAFSECANLKGVTLDNALTDIGDSAFEECRSLTKIKLPDSGVDDTIKLPDSLVTIGKKAFCDCSLTNFTITKNVSSIGSQFLYECYIDTLSVDPANTNYIVKDGILFSADSKTLVFCPQQLVFEHDKYEIPGSVETISPYALSGNSSLEEVTIPSSVKELPEGCFENSWVDSVDLPEGITAIGDYAFAGSGIESIELPASLISVNGFAFLGCSNLYEITVAKGSTHFIAGDDGALYSYDKTVLVAFPSGYWGSGDEEDDAYSKAFAHVYHANNGKLKANEKWPAKGRVKANDVGDNTFTVPDGVIEIGKGAFAGSGLMDINFGSGTALIDDKAFYDCEGLDIIDLPNNVSTIGDDAFGECLELSTVTAGTGLKTLSPTTFSSCYNLNAVYFLGNAPDVVKSDVYFPEVSGHLTLYYTASGTGFTSPEWLGYPSVVFDPNTKCTVTYKFNNGLLVDKTKQVYKGGKAIELYSYGNEEEIFLGWYKDIKCTKPWYFGTDTVNSDITLYGGWANYKNVYLGGLYLIDSNEKQVATSPEFNSKTLTYTATLPKKVSSFYAIFLPYYYGVKIYINGTKASGGDIDIPAFEKEYDNIKLGQTVKIAITVKLGKLKKTYTLSVTRPASADNLLTDIGSTAGTLDPVFSSGTNIYSLKLDENTGSVKITPVLSDKQYAKLYIDGKLLSNKTYNLNPAGTAVSKVKVVSQAGVANVYTVTITRAPSTDAYLKSLITDSKKYKITPAFTDKTQLTGYTVTLPENVSSITLNAKTEGYGAKLKITNLSTNASSAKGSLKVKVGNGSFVDVKVTVTAQDGTTTKEYSVRIFRKSYISSFAALPHPALTTGGSNTLTFNWKQCGAGKTTIQVLTDPSKPNDWQTEYTDTEIKSSGTYTCAWDGKVGGNYLTAGKYKARISVSYDDGISGGSITSPFKLLSISILNG